MIITQDERNYLLESMKALLSKYEYEHTDDALNKIIDEWSNQKKELINGFRKHPNYVEGKFLIAFPHQYVRASDRNAINNFSWWLENNALRSPDIPREIYNRKGSCRFLPADLWDFLTKLTTYSDQYISASTAEMLKRVIPEIHPRAGLKTSRVVNKICTYMGYNKIDGFNKEFAKYADGLNPITIERRVILSLNPLDYLTMSFGNSWSSCQTIDKQNLRRMPNGYRGQYSSGTMSYMLDASSMVLYTVDSAYNGDEYYNEPKINRQMFHYGEDKLVQGRLYPQSNDSGSSSLYDDYRNVVQKIVATIFDFPNLWTFKRGTYEICKYVRTDGTHYQDYIHFDNCTISKIKDKENIECLKIGARPICINCGDRHSFGDTIDCCGKHDFVCTECGCVISEEDTFFINGDPYCRDCVYLCDDCDDFVLETWTVYDQYGERYVCEECRDRYYNYCEDCGEYIHEDIGLYIASVDRWVCDDCLSEYFFCCEECGEYHPNMYKHSHNDRSVCESCFNKLSA